MKLTRLRPTTALITQAVVIFSLGVTFIWAGFFLRPATVRVLQRFQSGNLSVQGLAKLTGMQTEADCATERERRLFRAFVFMDEHCVDFLKSSVDRCNGDIAIGSILVFVGRRILFLAIGLRKQLAETVDAADRGMGRLP